MFDDGELITYGVLEAKGRNLMDRMKEMQELIGGLIEKYKPDHVVFEGIQFQRNYKTYMQLAQLQGIILAHLFRSKIAFSIVEASAWRRSAKIAGRKRAEQKKNTQKFVKEKYNIDCTEDEADAVGIGYWSINNIKGESIYEII